MESQNESLVRHYLLHRRTDAAPSTVRRSGKIAARWAAYLDGIERPMLAATTEDALEFVASWDRWRWSARTIRQSISVLRSLHAWLVDTDRASRNPWRPVRGPRVPKTLPRVLMAEEVESLDAAFCRPSVRDLRDRALLRLLATSGCRIGEAIGLDTKDVDLARGQAVVFGKNSKERNVFFTEDAAACLGTWILRGRPHWASSPSGPLFVGRHGKRLNYTVARDALIRAEQIARIGRHVNPHLLRHTYATHLLEGGANLREVQELLGHADLSTVQVYTHVSQQRLRATYDRIMAAPPASAAAAH